MMQHTNRDIPEKHRDLTTSAAQLIHVHKFLDNFEEFMLKSMSLTKGMCIPIH
jgi:hypothetical protein